MSSFDCLGTECTVDQNAFAGDLSDAPWDEGCRPDCGTCAVGTFCNASGMCQTNPVINTRTAASPVLVLLALCLLVLF